MRLVVVLALRVPHTEEEKGAALPASSGTNNVATKSRSKFRTKENTLV